MSPIVRQLLLLSLVLLVPVVPFLLAGSQVEQWVDTWSQRAWSPLNSSLVIVGLLATDIFLPIPSSLISTWAGQVAGPVWGTLASWVGMSLGAVLGFALARRWGYPLAARLTRTEDLLRMQRFTDRYGPFALVALRAVPVLAEASVLIMGVHRLSWARFLIAVLIANLGISLAYVAFGAVAQQQGWTVLALAISIVLPLLLLFVINRVLFRSDTLADAERTSDQCTNDRV